MWTTTDFWKLTDMSITHERGVSLNFPGMTFRSLHNTVTRKKTDACVFWTKRCTLCDRVFDWWRMQYRHYYKSYNCRAKQLDFLLRFLVCGFKGIFIIPLKLGFLFRTVRLSQSPNLQNCHNDETNVLRLWFGTLKHSRDAL